MHDSCAGGTHTANLWGLNGQHLELKTELSNSSGTPRSALWHPQSANTAICIHDSRWQLWTIGDTANVR